MPDKGTIKITASSFETAASALQSEVDQLGTIYTTLQSALNAMNGAWNGNGAKAFATASSYSQYDLSERIKELAQLIADVNATKSDFSEQDQRNAQSYSEGGN